MNAFLRAKHWHLFILMFGIPMIFYIFMMANVFSAAANGNPMAMFGAFKWFPNMMILAIGTQFGWFWSIGVGLQTYVPETVKMKVRKFKIFFFIPMGYMVLIMCFAVFIFLSIDATNPAGSGLLADGASMALVVPFLIVIPLHLFSMFCIFYCLYFVAKTLKTVEMQKQVQFGDFVGEFFSIWFYPIGIWFIQPRINKLVAETPTNQVDTNDVSESKA